jgi:hypothetical protein
MTDYIIITIGILMLVTLISLIRCIKLQEKNDEMDRKMRELNAVYHETLYDNCVLSDKLEKIKDLNLIDYNNNEYYKELLTINK